ncbi:ATP-binding cassette domain-containing protein, partial [Levilactobacillus brevis]|uniref:ATP-binding cassette domain-containing protein n=1 Tax=Levilactobacillus brevis TaxID=1580 RepID=UPI00057F84C7
IREGIPYFYTIQKSFMHLHKIFYALELPNGYDTKLSEDSGLSGGQLQRISIARALASQTSVLIFDESTSSLDLLTEKKVLDNIMTMKDKTIIFIAHRLEIAKKTTKIAVMKNGEIVESGTHDELLSNKKYYAQLWEQ